jgi:uncharacterized protein
MDLQTRNIRWWGLGLLFSLTILLSVYLLTSTLETLAWRNSKISVKGYAEQKISSDYATWHGTLTTRGASLEEAYSRLEEHLNLVLDYLERLGIDSKELKTSPANNTVFYKHTDTNVQTNEIDGYALHTDLSMESYNVSLISTVANQISSLMKEGVEIYSSKPQYFYTRIDDLKVHMLGEAAKDALLRAQQLASNSGSRVGKLKSAQQGVFQITPAFSTSISDYGENDTFSVEKSIKAVVTMEYAIH